MRNYSRFVFVLALFAWCLVMLGAYVRLSNAGLGCPDWPGCYGKLVVSQIPDSSSLTSPVEVHKAWKEMIHRYAASTLGLFILVLAFWSLKLRNVQGKRLWLPWFLVVWVFFQGMLGKWTVTLKLHPFVVLAHLLGGFISLALLWLLYLRTREETSSAPKKSSSSFWIGLGLVLLMIQIILGAWTSANYAALACPDFPMCQGHWKPPLDFVSAYGVWHEFGRNYEWGVLHNTARVTIHWMHRVGACVIFIYFMILGLNLLRQKDLRNYGICLIALVCLQVSLGISNIFFALPLPVAVAHNGVAALLLLTLVTLLQKTRLARV